MSRICIVIPCYNEEKRFNIVEFNKFYNAKSDNISFCLVNDGSNDNTIEILKNIQYKKEDRVLLVNLEKNKGKGEAVRTGIIESLRWKNFDYYAFFDADFSTPLNEIYLLLESIEKNPNYKISIGSRIKLLGNTIERKASRHYLGRIFSAFLSITFFKLPIYDTQCGAKLFKKEVINILFSEPFISRWIFDIEIFARLLKEYGHNKALEMIVEVPLLKWLDKRNSKINLFNIFFIVPYDLFRIYFKYFFSKKCNKIN